MAFVKYVRLCLFNFTNIMYIQFNYISALYRINQEQTAVPGEVFQVCERNHSRCIPAVPLFHGPQPVGSTRNSKYSCPFALIHLWVIDRQFGLENWSNKDGGENLTSFRTSSLHSSPIFGCSAWKETPRSCMKRRLSPSIQAPREKYGL